jgi:hypothetical protein
MLENVQHRWRRNLLCRCRAGATFPLSYGVPATLRTARHVESPEAPSVCSWAPVTLALACWHIGCKFVRLRTFCTGPRGFEYGRSVREYQTNFSATSVESFACPRRSRSEWRISDQRPGGATVVPVVPECAPSFSSCSMTILECLWILVRWCLWLSPSTRGCSAVGSAKGSPWLVSPRSVGGAVNFVLRQHSLLLKSISVPRAVGAVTVWVVAVVMWW